jgi:hypothetical protein
MSSLRRSRMGPATFLNGSRQAIPGSVRTTKAATSVPLSQPKLPTIPDRTFIRQRESISTTSRQKTLEKGLQQREHRNSHPLVQIYSVDVIPDPGLAVPATIQTLVLTTGHRWQRATVSRQSPTTLGKPSVSEETMLLSAHRNTVRPLARRTMPLASLVLYC